MAMSGSTGTHGPIRRDRAGELPGTSLPEPLDPQRVLTLEQWCEQFRRRDVTAVPAVDRVTKADPFAPSAVAISPPRSRGRPPAVEKDVTFQGDTDRRGFHRHVGDDTCFAGSFEAGEITAARGIGSQCTISDVSVRPRVTHVSAYRLARGDESRQALGRRSRDQYRGAKIFE
jgi:hypothetical protein